MWPQTTLVRRRPRCVPSNHPPRTSAVWERTRHIQRLRHALREYFPAALEAFEDLAAGDTLELLSKAPDPVSAARLSISQISAVLRRAGRRKIEEKAAVIQTALRAELRRRGLIASGRLPFRYPYGVTHGRRPQQQPRKPQQPRPLGGR